MLKYFTPSHIQTKELYFLWYISQYDLINCPVPKLSVTTRRCACLFVCAAYMYNKINT